MKPVEGQMPNVKRTTSPKKETEWRQVESKLSADGDELSKIVVIPPSSREYLVKTLAVTGKYVPYQGQHILHYFDTAVAIAARQGTQGVSSRVVRFRDDQVMV